MRKIVLSILFLVFALLWSPEKALACTLNLTPSAFNASAGETLVFHLERYPTHRQCVLSLEETKIIVTGGKLIDPGVWKKGTPDVLDFKVTFNQPGQATVRVERNCPKGGLIAVEARGMVEAVSSGVAPRTTTTETKPTNTEGPPATPKAGQDTLTVHPPQTANPPVTSTETDTASENLNPPGTTIRPTEEPQNSSTAVWLTKYLNLRLWLTFLPLGLMGYLLKLTRFRRPLLFLSVILLGFYLGGCPEPVGAPFYLLSRNEALFGTALLLLILPLAISLIWGRVFCGWVCPLGATQELIHAGQTWGMGSYKVPGLVDRVLKQMKFVALVVFGYLSWQTSHNAFSNYDPFRVLFNFDGTPFTVTLLILTLLASIFLARPFCRYLCPLGAVFTLTARIAPFAIRPDKEACSKCGLCAKENVCPMSAINGCDGVTPWPHLDAGECIMCRNCEAICRRSALKVRGRFLHQRR